MSDGEREAANQRAYARLHRFKVVLIGGDAEEG